VVEGWHSSITILASLARATVLGRPVHRQPQQINNEGGGLGLYWDDPDGHVLKIITVPYGGSSTSTPAMP
jgi:hypothetical protein